MDAKFKYYNPVKISFGIDTCFEEIQGIFMGNPASVDLFYEENTMSKVGALDRLKKALGECQIREYGNVKSNPEIGDLREFLSSRNEYGDWVVAIGGGSVMDFGKSVAFLATQQHNIDDFLAKHVDQVFPGLPFIAIPTTSGTGSEVTPWATFWDKELKKKYSLSHELMFPTHAIVDPLLTLSLPPMVTASTGFDAFSHSIEAFWSKFSNPVSDIYALKSMKLVMDNLSAAMNSPRNLEARSNMARASLYAGLAFSNTKTTAVHSVSYPMTLYYGVPHGTACALILGAFLMFNRDYINRDKQSALLDTLGYGNLEELSQGVKKLAEKLGLPINLKEAGIPAEGMEVILQEGFHPERVFNNPRELTRDNLRLMLESIYS